MITLTRRLGLVLAFVTAAASSIVAVPAAQAANGPDVWQQAQVGLTYTVYRPDRTLGLKGNAFALNGCGSGRDEQINAEYGSQSTTRSRWIGLNESQAPCQDGPDGVGPAATFTSHGAKVTVMGACAGGKSTCASANLAGVRRQAFTTVTLPAGGEGLSKTYVEVYSQALSLAQIKAFVNGLTPVQ